MQMKFVRQLPIPQKIKEEFPVSPKIVLTRLISIKTEKGLLFLFNYVIIQKIEK